MIMEISIKGLKKRFGRLEVLKNIDLELRSGQFWALLGRNGEGKSTLMRILMQQLPADGGELIFDGLPASAKEHARDGSLLKKIYRIDEGITYDLQCPLKEFYSHVSRFYPHWVQHEFERLVDLLKIPLDRMPAELSRGQRVQIQIAAAIAAQTEVIFLDEVTAVLDARARSVVLQELATFCARGGTVMLATNVATEVHGYADHVCVLEAGELVVKHAVVQLEELYLKALYTNDERSATERPKAPWVPLQKNNNSSLSLLARREHLKPSDLEALTPDRRAITVEDVFLYHTGQPRLEEHSIQKESA
jgi:ABC-2 type transport system ATP-binding protein